MRILKTKKIKKHALFVTSTAYLMLSASQLSASDHLQELDNELEAARLTNKAQQYSKAADFVNKNAKYVKYAGQAVSLAGAIDPDPHSAPILKGIGAGLNQGEMVLQKVVSPMLMNHSLNLKDEALRKSAPLSISEAIEKQKDDLMNEKEKLNKQLFKAKKDTWYRKVSDALLLSNKGKRHADAESKYRPLLRDNDHKLDQLIELKKRSSNINGYLNKKAAQTSLSQQEEELKAYNIRQISLNNKQLAKDIEYLLSQIKEAKNPEIYKDLITLKEKKLIRQKT